MSAHAVPSQLQVVGAALRRRATCGAIVQTATFNVLSARAAAVGGVILARAVGPTVRGEYAAVTSWRARRGRVTGNDGMVVPTEAMLGSMRATIHAADRARAS